MLRSASLLLGLFLLACSFWGNVTHAHILWFEAEDFEITGTWVVATQRDTFGGRILQGLTAPGSKVQDAFTYVEIPEAGEWHLWVRSRDFATNQGTRFFSLVVDGVPVEKLFGRHGKDSWAWEYGGSFFLAPGNTLVRLQDTSAYYARIDSLILTTDPHFVPPNDPNSPLAKTYKQEPVPAFLAEEASSPAALITGPVQSEELYTLANPYVRLEFKRFSDTTRQWIHPELWINSSGVWLNANLDPLQQAYLVLYSAQGNLSRASDYFPGWNVVSEINLGDTATQTQTWTQDPFAAGIRHWVFCDELEVLDAQTVRLRGRGTDFVFEADWQLEENNRYPTVTLRLYPEKAGYYSMAFVGFFQSALEDIDFLLLPYLWHSKRLPQGPRLNIEAYAPTPVALVQRTQEDHTLTYGLAPARQELYFRWPRFENSRFGLTIQGPEGGVQPGLFAPILGSEASWMEAGESFQFSLRVLVEEETWFATFRTLVTEEYGVEDYRTNWRYSLNDAVFNMIELLMDDRFGGWNSQGKGPLNIEIKSTVTHASPATLVSLYRLTGSEELFERRALPTIEFMLSRKIPHFTYQLEDADSDLYTTLGGPNTWYGASTYYALWELTDRLTPALYKYMWIRDGLVRTYSSEYAVPHFGEELAGYLATGDPTLLETTLNSARTYFQRRMLAPQREDLGLEPFFNHMFIPNWANFIDLYSLHPEDFILEGAKEGAHWQLTGIWTQPPVIDGSVQISLEEVLKYGVRTTWWYGDERFRLGFPLEADKILIEEVPAWVVSPVGLGFEQPITHMSSGGSLVLMSNWAADLVRLTELTGDEIYRTFARNAVLGRFANYPGYYVNHFSTIYMQPDFPYVGPDTTSIYYHHIIPQLAYTIDFLLAEAQYRSQGEIRFPWVRQQGYVWFSDRLYGHAPGQLFHYDRVWPWINREVLHLDNPAINYITGHNEEAFFVYLMNESPGDERVTVRWNENLLGLDTAEVEVSVYRQGEWERRTVSGHSMDLVVPGKGEVALVVHGTQIQVATHHINDIPVKGEDAYLMYPTYDFVSKDIYGAVIQTDTTHYYAYIYTNSLAGMVETIRLHYYTLNEDHKQVIEKKEFPFVFTVKVTDSEDFWFQLEFVDKFGRTRTSPWLHLKGTLQPR